MYANSYFNGFRKNFNFSFLFRFLQRHCHDLFLVLFSVFKFETNHPDLDKQILIKENTFNVLVLL